MDESFEETANRLIEDMKEDGLTQEEISEIGLIIWENTALDEVPDDEVIH